MQRGAAEAVACCNGSRGCTQQELCGARLAFICSNVQGSATKGRYHRCSLWRRLEQQLRSCQLAPRRCQVQGKPALKRELQKGNLCGLWRRCQQELHRPCGAFLSRKRQRGVALQVDRSSRAGRRRQQQAQRINCPCLSCQVGWEPVKPTFHGCRVGRRLQQQRHRICMPARGSSAEGRVPEALYRGSGGGCPKKKPHDWRVPVRRRMVQRHPTKPIRLGRWARRCQQQQLDGCGIPCCGPRMQRQPAGAIAEAGSRWRRRQQQPHHRCFAAPRCRVERRAPTGVRCSGQAGLQAEQQLGGKGVAKAGGGLKQCARCAACTQHGLNAGLEGARDGRHAGCTCNAIRCLTLLIAAGLQCNKMPHLADRRRPAGAQPGRQSSAPPARRARRRAGRGQ